ncbi:hypothetical protein GCM10009713_09170 [Brevibacterium celere]
MAHVRLRRARDLPEHALVAGDVADGEDAQALFGGDPADERLLVGERLLPGGRELPGGDRRLGRGQAGEVGAVVLGEESDAHGVLAGRGQVDVLLFTDHLGEVVVRDLQGEAGAVAGALVGADAAAVLELAQRPQRLFDDLVVGRTAVADDESETARIVFERGVVESGALRRELWGR